MESKVISQKEYLKKYLSSGNPDDKKKKKKKKKAKVGQQTVKLIDDDIDLNSMRPIEDGEFDILLNSEDAPQIAGIIDERGPVDFSDKRRWRIIADDDDDGDITISSTYKGRVESANIIEKQNGNSSKSRKVYSDDGDVDPPRNQTRFQDDLSSPRPSDLNTFKSKHSKHSNHQAHSNEKLRKKNAQNKPSSNNSSTSRECRDSDSDLSPPRPGKSVDSDASPPRRICNDSNSFNLNSHKGINQHEDSDLSPPRQDKHYDSDLSPPRRSEKSRSSDSRLERHSRKCRSSISPHERNRRDRISDTRRSRRSGEFDPSGKSRSYKDSDSRHEKRRGSDKSPSRKRNYESRNQSPPRRSRESNKNVYDKSSNDYRNSKSESYLNHASTSGSGQSREKSSRWDSGNESNGEAPKYDKRMKKTLDGKTAGLQDARALKEETEAHKKREAEQFRKLTNEVSGVGQATIIRDRKTGRKRNLEAEAAAEREKQQRQAELDEKYTVWGKGVKQVEDREEKLKDDLYEMSKPLARYADDADLDKALRQQEREGDPMLQYIKQKQIKEGKRKPDQPRYEGTFMPNRFGIKPGHRWDGVDRSNGYEKRWFEAQNAKVARQEEAYKWSTSDM